MQFSEAVKLALQALWANKMRSVLTLLGVVMGVGSVITVITMINGADTYVSTKLSGYGADVFQVSRTGLTASPEDYFKYQKRKLIRYEDYEAIRDGCSNCSEVGTQLSKNTKVAYNGHSSTDTAVRGATYSMMSLNDTKIDSGRGLTTIDVDKATRNVIIGYDIVDNLMGSGSPLGKEIRVDGIPYNVIGVGERKGKTGNMSQDNWVVIPITTYQQTYGYNDSLSVYARGKGGTTSMEQAEDEVRVLMRSRHHVGVGVADDFELETNDTFLELFKQITSIFASVVVGIASISLVVGGIVIMNIMLVSVTERTREIGVRKALGARQRDILLQFLIESGTMSLVGGAIGVMSGMILAKLITLVVGFPTAVPLWSVFVALFVSAATGIFFGVYPASKAAKLDPVVALRAEL